MASDRARISRDPSRLWRSVVAQQGRVQLEADLNEAWEIEGDGRRDEVIDIIGPAGTPDDGYKVGPDGGRLRIGRGTMYLGGWRLTLDQAIHDDAQPDWLDAPPLAAVSGREVVLLRATEQEVGAVEDPALLDVALGGPDTSARTRLLQHVLRWPVRGDTCAEAAGEIARELDKQGLSLDGRTLQLLSDARLKVEFVPPTPKPGPCDPPAEGGYLGADNQLIQVTVSSFNPATRRGTLLWGYNNASFLHRATSDGAGRLVLVGRPLDSEHEPRQNRPIEVLRRRVRLEDGSFVAAPEGEIRSVQAYDPDERRITFAPALPTDYAGTAAEPLFVRLWQAEIPFHSGQPALLDPTGLTVTVDIAALPTLAGRPFWRFAVRPSTPLEVYPVRYKTTPQPPDGPRQWLCRLAVIAEASNGVRVLEDCRVPFLPLTLQENEGNCCAVVLDPEQVRKHHGLQAIIDKLCAKGPASISLRPGRYLLNDPLHLDARHDGLVLEGCQDGAVLAADGRSLDKFAPGLIVVDHADEVILRRLRFEMPLVATDATHAFPKPTDDPRTHGKAFVSVGVMAIHAPRLRVEACQFRYRLPDKGPPGRLRPGARPADPVEGRLIALGIYGRGQCTGFVLRNCAFLHDERYESDPVLFRFLIGYALAPETPAGGNPTVRALNVDGPVGDAAIDNGEIVGNRFAGLTLACVVLARMGFIRCAENRVLDCVGGFYFLTSNLGATLQLLWALARQTVVAVPPSTQEAFKSLLNLPLLRMVSELGLLIPRPDFHAHNSVRSFPRVVFTSQILRLVTGEFKRIAADGLKAFTDQKSAAVDAAAGQPLTAAQAAAAGLSEADFAKLSIANAPPNQVLGLLKDDEPIAAPGAPDAQQAAVLPNDVGTRVLSHQEAVKTDRIFHEEDFQRVNMVAVAAKVADIRSHPMLHIRENDIRILGLLDPEEASSDTGNPLAKAYAGVSVIFEYGEGDAGVMLQDNRVRLDTVLAPAAGLLYAEYTLASGNLLIQPLQHPSTPPRGPVPVDGLVVYGEDREELRPHLETMANLVHGAAFIYPQRFRVPTDRWDLVNELRSLQP